MNLPHAMSKRVSRTRKVSMIARKTKGAHLSMLSKSWPPTRVKTKVPSEPAKANTPIIDPLILLGMPFMSSTSTDMASMTVKIISSTHIAFDSAEFGSVIQMKEYPVIPRSVNATGTRTVDGILSPSWPRIGSSKIVTIVAVRIIV